MATKPISTAKIYLLTSEGPTTATLTHGENSISWEALSDSGQTTIIIPAGATLTLSNPKALLSPLPFDSALAVGNGNSGGRTASPAGVAMGTSTEAEAIVQLTHEQWLSLGPSTHHCTLKATKAAEIAQTHLVLTPAATMPTGWLTAADGAVLRWPYGEIAMTTGWSYIITLLQIGNVILANATPVDLSTPA